MEIDINLLVGHKLTPNSYVYLYFLVHKKMCPLNMKVNEAGLEKSGYLKITPGQIIPRQKAVNLFPEAEYAKAQSELAKDMMASVDDWIQEWRELFPKGVKTGGYPVRGSKGGCTKKMKAFIKVNKGVGKALIFDATRKYIAEKASQRYQYMKMADYFISKDGISMLESYIESYDPQDSTPVHTVENYDPNTNNLTEDI